MNNELITLRNVLFPDEDICTQTDLYYRMQPDSQDAVADTGSGKGYLRISGTTAFDTYFNSLAVVSYKKYCKLSALFLRLRVCGFFVLRIFCVRKKDGVFEEELLSEETFGSENITEYKTDISKALENGCENLYFTLSSEGGILYGGEYLCGCTEVKRTDIAVVICTYKREKFLLHNHRAICEYIRSSSALNSSNIKFYIVDNGRTLDKEIVENDFVTLIPNDNTGGSGGFTRGYYEAVNSGRDFTHILFMDDDIVLDCEMLLRVYSILQTRRDEFSGLAVGGTMIRLSDRITQHEAGSVWDGRRLNSIGEGADITLRENVFDIAHYPQGNYNAWWFYCFPSEWQEKYGYPLQFFVKEDDIEYSLRCADDIAVISGIAVWHDDFDGKYDGFQEYYIKRNELIMTSVASQKPYALFQVRKLILSVMKQTVYQRYFLADIIFRAYDDYLRGWEHFKNTDTASLNTELMNYCQPLLSDDELYSEYGVYFDEDKYNTSLSEPENLKLQALSMNGYLIPSVFYRKDKDGFSMTDLAKCRIVNFYKHKRVLHYDVSKRKGFVTRQRRTKLFKNIFKLIYKSIRFLIKYPSVRKGYKKHLKELSQFP